MWCNLCKLIEVDIVQVVWRAHCAWIEKSWWAVITGPCCTTTDIVQPQLLQRISTKVSRWSCVTICSPIDCIPSDYWIWVVAQQQTLSAIQQKSFSRERCCCVAICNPIVVIDGGWLRCECDDTTIRIAEQRIGLKNSRSTKRCVTISISIISYVSIGWNLSCVSKLNIL